MEVLIETKLDHCIEHCQSILMKQRMLNGHWAGKLSSSALSTATAIAALKLSQAEDCQPLIQEGLKWLAEHQNKDGGWGDSIRSHSNISTSALCWAALTLCDQQNEYPETRLRIEAYMSNKAGGLDIKTVSDAIYTRYGKDRTFAVPILTMLNI